MISKGDVSYPQPMFSISGLACVSLNFLDQVFPVYLSTPAIPCSNHHANSYQPVAAGEIAAQLPPQLGPSPRSSRHQSLSIKPSPFSPFLV